MKNIPNINIEWALFTFTFYTWTSQIDVKQGSLMCNPGKIVLCPTLQFGQIVVDGSVGQYHKRQTDVTTSIESSPTKD